MENGIYEANDTFNFNQILLIKPIITSGNNFFIRYLCNDTPLYIQPPKCILKEGFTKSGKRIYCDLVFSNENIQFIQWMENLENITQSKIFENREKWFETELELHDIENSFISALKIYKSGKNYIMRVNVPCILGKCNLKVYNEDEEEVLPENLNENENVFAIVEFKGIKCSSRSFQIEIELKQLMLVKPKQLFDKCILKSGKSYDNKNHLGNNNDNVIDKMIDEPDIVIGNNDTTVSTIIDNMENPIAEIDIQEPVSESKTEINNEEPIVDDPLSNLFEPEEKIIEDLHNIPQSEQLLQEIHFNLEDLPTSDTVEIKDRNDVYYKMYSEALTRAKMARDLALSNYLESKHITNTFLLTEIKDDDIEDM